jgi:hypothetical protein
MSTKFIAPLAAVGAALAAAVAFAPVAAAENQMDCQDSTMSSVCTKSGHAAIVATPGNTRAGGAGFWPFGAGPVPPIWAMG